MINKDVINFIHTGECCVVGDTSFSELFGYPAFYWLGKNYEISLLEKTLLPNF